MGVVGLSMFDGKKVQVALTFNSPEGQAILKDLGFSSYYAGIDACAGDSGVIKCIKSTTSCNVDLIIVFNKKLFDTTALCDSVIKSYKGNAIYVKSELLLSGLFTLLN